MKACIGEFTNTGKDICKECPHRKQCQAFSAHTKRTQTEVSDYFEICYNGMSYSIIGKDGFSHDQFLELCNAQIKYDNEMGRRKKRSDAMKGKDHVSAKTHKKAGEGAKKAAQKKLEATINEYLHFKKYLKKELGKEFARRFFAPARGQLVEHVSWTKQSRKTTLYYKNSNYKEVRVCYIVLKTQTQTLDFYINVGVDKFMSLMSSVDRRKVAPIASDFDRANPEFNTFCRMMNREQSSIVAEVIAKLIKEGYFE